MSVHSEIKKITVKTLAKMKQDGEKITMLTAYDHSTAKYLDDAGVDTILIGDSVGMTVLGYDTTLKVTTEEMKIFTSAVARGTKRAMIISDLPFMSLRCSVDKAIENTVKIIQAGADAIKIEGADNHSLEVIARLSDAGIPVVAHLGFTPQKINAFGGYFVQGKTKERSEELIDEALKTQAAGAVALVLEMVPEQIAQIITEKLHIPTIGIGAGRFCDGQVLVIDDITGKFGEFTPKFVKKYSNIKEIITNCAEKYVFEVKNGIFPAEENTFQLTSKEALKN